MALKENGHFVRLLAAVHYSQQAGGALTANLLPDVRAVSLGGGRGEWRTVYLFLNLAGRDVHVSYTRGRWSTGGFREYSALCDAVAAARAR